MFLIGPLKQLKNMVALHRLVATIVFVISMALTLMAGLWVRESSFSRDCPVSCCQLTSFPFSFFLFLSVCMDVVVGSGFVLQWHSVALTVVFMLVQFGALFWYCLSYIPYGRDLCKKCMGSVVTEVV